MNEKKIKELISFATEAHAGQQDKGGNPYIGHILRVANSVKHKGYEVMAAAILHDVVEDTKYTMEDIKALGVPDSVVDAVKVLTHADGEPYIDYIARVKMNPIAKAVKKADLKDNMDLSRLNEIAEEDMKRVRKYLKSMEILNA